MDSFEKFVDRLTYFGAALNGDMATLQNEYQDYELFLLEASRNLSHDTRVTQAFVHWVVRYGCLASPSKLRRVIQDGIEYHPAILGAIIDLIQSGNERLQSWKILKPFVKKAKPVTLLFSHLPPPRTNQNEFFLKWGIVAPALNEAESKYLVPTSQLLKKCPELRYRAEGTNSVAADIRAFNDKNATMKLSLYELAKQIHQPRAQVNGFYRQLAKLEVLADLRGVRT